MSLDIAIIEQQMREHRVAPELRARILEQLNRGDWWRLEAKRLQYEIDRLTPHVAEEIRNPPVTPYTGNYVKRTGG